MEKFPIDKYDTSKETVGTVFLSIEEIVENPYGLYMVDVGLVLLNRLRKEKGLPELPKNSIAPGEVRIY